MTPYRYSLDLLGKQINIHGGDMDVFGCCYVLDPKKDLVLEILPEDFAKWLSEQETDTLLTREQLMSEYWKQAARNLTCYK